MRLASDGSILTKLLKQLVALQEPISGFCRHEVPAREFVGKKQTYERPFSLACKDFAPKADKLLGT
jgi:hypothetical protein